MSATPLEIQLLGKSYKVACAPEERNALTAAAAFLDARLQEAASKGRASGERLAVMVALNLAHELLSRSSDSSFASNSSDAGIDSDQLARKIGDIEARIDSVLTGR